MKGAVRKNNRATRLISTKQKIYFDTYAEAQMWLENTRLETDGTIHPDDDGKYVIFIAKED